MDNLISKNPIKTKSDEAILAAVKRLKKKREVISQHSVAYEAGLSQPAVSLRMKANPFIRQLVIDAQGRGTHISAEDRILNAILELAFMKEKPLRAHDIHEHARTGKISLYIAKSQSRFIVDLLDFVNQSGWHRFTKVDWQIIDIAFKLVQSAGRFTNAQIAKELGYTPENISVRRKSNPALRTILSTISADQGSQVSDDVIRHVLATMQILAHTEQTITWEGLFRETRLSAFDLAMAVRRSDRLRLEWKRWAIQSFVDHQKLKLAA